MSKKAKELISETEEVVVSEGVAESVSENAVESVAVNVGEKIVESPKAVAARAISPTTKIGVAKYLQLKPQPADIAALMKKKYAMQVHTIAEWDKIVDNLLNKFTN